jgi:tRNA modification GTPase
MTTRVLGGLPTPRQATVGEFRNADGKLLDKGIALYFPAPASFTGESVIELHGHGGPTVVAMLVDAIVALGARRAEAGEFSRRAFLNDKLDLTQAEAIADLIGAGSAQAARAALRSLSGRFSAAVDALAEALTRLRLHVEAAIDFPEEEIDFLSDQKLRERLIECDAAFEQLMRDAESGRVLRDGLRIVIVGRPNAGKSSLLNLLSGHDSAIVTEVAGTTRDILREHIQLDGLTVELVDTAGLRSDPDRIEAEGIRRAREALRTADAALWMVDADSPSPDDAELPEEDLPADTPLLVVRNKIDLTSDDPGLRQDGPPTLNLSVLTGAGVEDLRAWIYDLAGQQDHGEGGFTARQRHIDALSLAKQHFSRGSAALDESRAGEILAEELRLSQQALGEITGAVSSDDLLGKIFSEFCIGK